jgi:hypothetical protein
MKRALVILVLALWASIFLSDTASARWGYHAGFVGVRRVVVGRS